MFLFVYMCISLSWIKRILNLVFLCSFLSRLDWTEKIVRNFDALFKFFFSFLYGLFFCSAECCFAQMRFIDLNNGLERLSFQVGWRSLTLCKDICWGNFERMLGAILKEKSFESDLCKKKFVKVFLSKKVGFERNCGERIKIWSLFATLNIKLKFGSFKPNQIQFKSIQKPIFFQQLQSKNSIHVSSLKCSNQNPDTM